MLCLYRNNITKYEIIQPCHSTLNVKNNAKKSRNELLFPVRSLRVLYDIGRSKQIG